MVKKYTEASKKAKPIQTVEFVCHIEQRMNNIVKLVETLKPTYAQFTSYFPELVKHFEVMCKFVKQNKWEDLYSIVVVEKVLQGDQIQLTNKAKKVAAKSNTPPKKQVQQKQPKPTEQTNKRKRSSNAASDNSEPRSKKRKT